MQFECNERKRKLWHGREKLRGNWDTCKVNKHLLCIWLRSSHFTLPAHCGGKRQKPSDIQDQKRDRALHFPKATKIDPQPKMYVRAITWMCAKARNSCITKNTSRMEAYVWLSHDFFKNTKEEDNFDMKNNRRRYARLFQIVADGSWSKKLNQYKLLENGYKTCYLQRLCQRRVSSFQ